MEEGFEFCEGFVPPDELKILRAECDRFAAGKHGVRNLLSRSNSIREFAWGPWRQALIDRGFGDDLRPVRGILFDKIEGANWSVPWHQDRCVALRERRDADGFSNWTIKDEVPHADAPTSLLEKMITLRVFVDDCGPENGPLRVRPRSHLLGKADASTFEGNDEFVCTGPAGSALLMRPLLMHASSSAKSPHHRRVVHIEYAPTHGLPDALEWAEEIS